MKKVLKKFLGMITITIYIVFAVIVPMPIYAGSEVPGDSPIIIPNFNMYALVAYFEGIEQGIVLDDNVVTMPREFTEGNVIIKAKVCIDENNDYSPDYGQEVCPNREEVTLHVEGIMNGEQINNTVRTSSSSIIIQEGFNNYGKASVHITSNAGDGFSINQAINIVTEDLISIKAETPLSISQSFGTAAVNQALLTNIATGNVSIFFGNIETTLYVSGPNVDKITEVVGGTNVAFISLNEDGSATIRLPELFKETTTTVDVTILMKDGTFVERKININRTSISLQHSNAAGDNSVYAGYVFNKAYLYNNQNHNDEIFDAYLQITLYKDDVVVGFKQVKIDDEDYINNIRENESGSMELYSDDQIPLYGKVTDDLIEGVNKVSVFLTNGPIEFDKELPSIEFGIGSGVTLEWEEN